MGNPPNALTKGSVLKALVTFTVPFLLANVLQSLYGAVDLFVVGQFCDAQAVAAVSTGTQVTQIVTSLVTGLTLGGTILVGNYTGMERWDKVKEAIGTTLSVFAVVAVLLTALMLLCVIIGMVCEVIRWRGNYDKIAAGLKVFLQSMGKALSGVVALVIAAGVFAEGFKALGMLDASVDVAHNVGAGAVGMSILFVAITTLVTIIAGSNGASFYPLVEMVPKIARDMGVNPVTLVLPMHQASTIARPLSPVAGVVVAIAGMLQMNPFELIKRASVPCIVGLIVHHVSVFWLAI